MDANIEKSLNVLAEKVAEYIQKRIYPWGAEEDSFSVEDGDLWASIQYTARYSYDKGDRWTPPSWDFESECIKVEEVDIDGEADKEAAVRLQEIIDNMTI